MNPNAHLSSILILGEDNRFHAFNHVICDNSEMAERCGTQALTHLSNLNPNKQLIHRTMPFQHVPNAAALKTDI